MKFGKNLQIQVLNDSVFENFSNYFEEWDIQDGVR